MNKIFSATPLLVFFLLLNCQKGNSEVPTSSPFRKINLQSFLNSSESKKFSIELAKGKIGVHVLNIPKLPRKINLVLEQDDCTYYVIRGNLQLTIPGAENIEIQPEEVLFVPAGLVHTISSSKNNSKVLMVKSTNQSEIRYLQDEDLPPVPMADH
ncbi:hypothetical protein [Leptospira kmetyi]|uniref:Cupin domain-containing protein n=1 Tax=Leptospira kmetyi TaxID=408139 RepID=A0AAD0UWF8_9LEPT|nr:hypothetical protein [Leptospira kmetyi]AYV57583.1 hypothetical protein EFP84_14915 [Leptospira kmetyi]PJZ31261.1 hypothetical protein CH378_03425 [Leptospira kmetyi]PJZ40215.1 hypothetical protein CH370_17015 [Leptospira kmetyi]